MALGWPSQATICASAHAGAAFRVLGQECRLRMRLIEVLDDRHLQLSLDTRPSCSQPLLVPAVVDASVGQGDHAAGNPDVEHRRCGILQELPGRGAELIHARTSRPLPPKALPTAPRSGDAMVARSAFILCASNL